MKRTLSIITAAALTASCFSAAFADSSNTPPAMPGNGDTSMSQPGSSQSLQTLVTGGIISQETLDAILKYLEENPTTHRRSRTAVSLTALPTEMPTGNRTVRPTAALAVRPTAA